MLEYIFVIATSWFSNQKISSNQKIVVFTFLATSDKFKNIGL